MKKSKALKHVMAACVLVLGFAPALYAQETLPSPSTPLAAGVPAAGQPGQVFVPAAAQGMPAGTALGASVNVTGTSGNNLQGNIQQPQIVKDAVSGLQKTDPINLDDMIRAQDAINRLDLLLEIEKRQLELKKIQDEKTKPAMPSMGMGIPAAALNMPPMTMSAPVAKPRVRSEDDGESDAPSSSLDKLEIDHITGANGRYTAILKEGDKEYTARAGDTIAGKIKVRSVSLTSVTLVKGKKSKTLKMSSESYLVRGHSGATE